MQEPQPLDAEEKEALAEIIENMRHNISGQRVVQAVKRLLWLEAQIVAGTLVRVLPAYDTPERQALLDSVPDECPPMDAKALMTDDKTLFYIQDTRGYAGNSPRWWGPDGQGYVISINRAGRYTFADAISRAHSDHNVLWPCELIDRMWQAWVDSQHLPHRMFDREKMAPGMVYGGMDMFEIRRVLYPKPADDQKRIVVFSASRFKDENLQVPMAKMRETIDTILDGAAEVYCVNCSAIEQQFVRIAKDRGVRVKTMEPQPQDRHPDDADGWVPRLDDFFRVNVQILGIAREARKYDNAFEFHVISNEKSVVVSDLMGQLKRMGIEPKTLHTYTELP